MLRNYPVHSCPGHHPGHSASSFRLAADPRHPRHLPPPESTSTGLLEGCMARSLTIHFFSVKKGNPSESKTMVRILNIGSNRIPFGIVHRFFLTHPLHSKTDCETFLIGWFHATAGSFRGKGRSEVQSRKNNSLPRPKRDLSAMLVADAISKGQGRDGIMGAGALCLVLPKLLVGNAGRIHRPRRANMGCPNEGRRKEEDFEVPCFSSTEGRGKEVSPEANHRAYLECVLSDRASRNRCRSESETQCM